MVGELDTSLTELNATWAAKKNEWGQISVEMKRWFGDVIVNMLLKIMIGKRCVGPNAMGGEEEAKDLQMAIRDSFHLMGEGLLRDYIPMVAKLGFDGQVKAMEKIAERIDAIMGGWLKQLKRKRAYGNLDKKDGDFNFMDSLFSLSDAKEFPSCFDRDTLIKATTLVLLFFDYIIF